jgi:uncharacterized membrane protein
MHILGHPVHQMLIVYPAGLLMTSVLFDLISWSTGSAEFAIVSYWLIVAGLISGAAAAVFGLLDWLKIEQGTRARSVGMAHGLTNVAVMAIFAISFFLRDQTSMPTPTDALVMSLIGAVLLGAGAWLGGELVVRLGVGVNRNAHPNAPSSFDVPGDTVPVPADNQGTGPLASPRRSASR